MVDNVLGVRRRWAAGVMCYTMVLLLVYTGWHDAGSEGCIEQVVPNSCQESVVQANETGPTVFRSR